MPRSGMIKDNRLAATAQYKRAIPAARITYESKTNDRLLNSMLERKSLTFWNERKKYFGAHANATAISDNTSSSDIYIVLLSVLKTILKLVMIVLI